MPILSQLLRSNRRYNELRRELTGITNIMLTRSLKELEEHGLVSRTQHSESPPNVEYTLTDEAKKLIPALMLLDEWGKTELERKG